MDNKAFERHILIASDSVQQLRKCDVFRVLSEAPDDTRQSLARYIAEARPDLTIEAVECLEEMG